MTVRLRVPRWLAFFRTLPGGFVFGLLLGTLIFVLAYGYATATAS